MLQQRQDHHHHYAKHTNIVEPVFLLLSPTRYCHSLVDMKSYDTSVPRNARISFNCFFCFFVQSTFLHEQGCTQNIKCVCERCEVKSR